MKLFLRQFKTIIFSILLVHCVAASVAQVKTHKASSHKKSVNAEPASDQLKDFRQLVADADMSFQFPADFREVPVLDDEDYSFDYAMEIPGKEFELWLQVKPQKSDYANYDQLRNDKGKQLESPDSLYIKIGQAQARALSADQYYFMRNISSDVLARYKANAGKSYLLSIADLPETKHYKYALLLTLEKDHMGTILIVCFTNEKNPEFFKNVNRISRYLRFK